MAKKYVVSPTSEFPENSQRVAILGGRPIAIFNVKGEYFAMLNRCPHQGASLCDGARTGFVESSRPGEFRYTRAGEIIRCPWHGWEFDIRNGQSWFDPQHTKVKMYETEVSSGSELIKGPYKAETFEVTVED